ncbi:MAG: hypothetical protein H6766_06295 [Candidatus Peribacteria bacterium]|nr:MAG: hypothetical protein H6766_06295 [Candidatus Peribacteria bacterium]
MQKIITPLIIAGMIACSNRASGKMKVSTDNIKKELVIVFDKNIAFNRDHADSIVTSYDQYVE